MFARSLYFRYFYITYKQIQASFYYGARVLPMPKVSYYITTFKVPKKYLDNEFLIGSFLKIGFKYKPSTLSHHLFYKFWYYHPLKPLKDFIIENVVFLGEL